MTVTGALDHRAAELLAEFSGDVTEALQHRAPALVTRSRGSGVASESPRRLGPCVGVPSGRSRPTS